MGYIEELRALVGHRPLLFVGSVVVIVNEKEEVLLQQRTFPSGAWGLPGGLMELGESTEEVARREVMEETGLTMGDLQLINVYSGSDQYIKAANGDEFYVVTIAYYTKEFSGSMVVDLEESIKFEFRAKCNLPDGIVKSHQKILQDYYKLAQ